METLIRAAAITCGFTAMTAHADEFKVGDVIDVAFGGFECFGKDNNSPDGIRRTIIALRDTGWKGVSPETCSRLDPSYAYEIMKVADGESGYNQVYCLNSVHPYPINKSGCVWAAFPRARRSECKADRALNPGELPDQADVDRFFKIDHHHMACQGVAMPAVEYAGPFWKSTGDGQDDGAAIFLVYSEHCDTKSLNPENVAYARARLRLHPAEVQGTIDHETRNVLAYRETWCSLFGRLLEDALKR